MKSKSLLHATLAALALTMIPAHAEPGLTAKRYNFAPSPTLIDPISNLLGESPSNVWLWEGPLTKGSWGENYSVLWEGVLGIEVDDIYTFGTRSDDGSAVYIDINGDGDYADTGEYIVNNNAWQGATERIGSVMLEGGRQYKFIIGYYQGGGGAEMTARWRRGNHSSYSDLEVLDTVSGFFRTRFEPVVDNLNGATAVSGEAAILNGRLVAATNAASAAVSLFWGGVDGETNVAAWAHSHVFPAPQAWGMKTLFLTGLASNTVYYYRTQATDAVTQSWAQASSAWITAPVAVEVVQDASEAGNQIGVLRFTRPQAVAGCALDVFYTVGGTAVAGVNYEPLPGVVEMPSGAATVDVVVVPLDDWINQADTTVVVSMADGPYIPDPVAAQLVVANEIMPDDPGTNVWIGAGAASVAANWSKGRLPLPGEVVRLGEFSVADLVWDAPVNGLPTTLGGWIQEAGYTGVVTIPTTYPLQSTVFTQLVVNSHMRIEGGKLTHPSQPTKYKAIYRLCLAIHGDLVVGPDAVIDADGRGYTGDDSGGPGSAWRPNNDTSVAAHGGFSGFNNAWGQSRRTYGSVFAPYLPGSRGQAYEGGGAIWLEVGGIAAIQGSIRANGAHTKWGAGSGGSVFLRAGSLVGSGEICSDGGKGVNPWNPAEGWGPCGGGGRISVILASGTDTGDVRLRARGGDQWSDDRRGGPGTVYLEIAGQPVGGGTVRIDNDWRSWDQRIRAQLPPSYTIAYDGEISTPVEDFSKISLELGRCGWLELTDGMQVQSVKVDRDSRLFLAGHTLTTKSFLDNGTALAPGTYTAADLDRVSDDGSVVVLPAYTVLMVR